MFDTPAAMLLQAAGRNWAAAGASHGTSWRDVPERLSKTSQRHWQALRWLECACSSTGAQGGACYTTIV